MQVQRAAPIRHQVAGLLRAAIADLRLPPGRVLVERELCELTGASRPSVREALRQLESEGLVVSVPGRGTRVATVDRADAAHVYEVRAALEGLAARRFTTDATPAQRARLRAAVEATADAGSTGDLLAAKNRFYAVLLDGCGNPVVARLLETLHRRITALRATTLARPDRPAESRAEIGRILAAIEAGDAAAAERAAVEHVRSAERAALASLSADDHSGLSTVATVEEAG